MKENEALKYLKEANRKNDMLCVLPNSDIGKCIINALEEIQQYREIGTMEKIKEELDRLRNDNECQGLYFTFEEGQDLARQHKELETYRSIGTVEECREAVEKQKAKQGWIPCSEQLPPVETEVYILAKRKYKGGDCKYIRTTAMYEDGTILENDSCWRWEDIEGEWDEENDCYIIPEGWWENRHYNPDEVYNNVVDDEVVAWQPLPELYIPCTNTECTYHTGNECPAQEGCAGYQQNGE